MNLNIYKSMCPHISSLHHLSAFTPEECVMIVSQCFHSVSFPTIFYIPTYNKWLDSKLYDSLYIMKWHEKVLKTLQSSGFPNENNGRWLLKSPYHTALISEIKKVYPDALIIHNHRSPVKVMSSISSVAANLIGIASDNFNLSKLAQYTENTWELYLKKAIKDSKFLYIYIYINI